MGYFSMHLFCILLPSSRSQIHRFRYVIMFQRSWLLWFSLLLTKCGNCSTLPSVYSFEWSSELGMLPLASFTSITSSHCIIPLHHPIASFTSITSSYCIIPLHHLFGLLSSSFPSFLDFQISVSLLNFLYKYLNSLFKFWTDLSTLFICLFASSMRSLLTFKTKFLHSLSHISTISKILNAVKNLTE